MSPKFLTLPILAMLAALALAPIAGADPPVREPVDLPDVTGQFCEDFPVLVHATVNREFITTFSDGRMHISGTQIVELTNLDTGNSIEVNASGPGTITSDGTTLIALGRLLLFGEAGFFGPEPELSINAGRTVISLVDFSIISRAGYSQDLCPALAAA